MKCDEEMENTEDLRKHRESCRGTHKCEECEGSNLENNVQQLSVLSVMCVTRFSSI